MSNPFQPLNFYSGLPAAAPWETGPTLFAAPYAGQNQTSKINTAAAKPPTESGPLPAVGMSKIP